MKYILKIKKRVDPATVFIVGFGLSIIAFYALVIMASS